ncbi:hypothetical protein BTR23_25015 [Alkalihalophilus pseudofirmus]|nr:hypothetical protein BTR23_25015 [Alkalihalophilus pseudofirmus]
MTNTILFSEMIPEEEWEQKFNDWYNAEHIPIRINSPGFMCARRYKELDSRKYLAVYEMETKEALNTQEYKNIKENPSELTSWMLQNVGGFTRYTAEEISEQKNSQVTGDPYDASILYPVMFEVPEHRQDEFNRWYTEDHVPTLLENPHWLACRRYKIFSGEPGRWTHLALHYLEDVKVLECEERKKARNSKWREKLASEEWFKGKYMVFEKINKIGS